MQSQVRTEHTYVSGRSRFLQSVRWQKEKDLIALLPLLGADGLTGATAPRESPSQKKSCLLSAYLPSSCHADTIWVLDMW